MGGVQSRTANPGPPKFEARCKGTFCCGDRRRNYAVGVSPLFRERGVSKETLETAEALAGNGASRKMERSPPGARKELSTKREACGGCLSGDAAKAWIPVCSGPLEGIGDQVQLGNACGHCVNRRSHKMPPTSSTEHRQVTSSIVGRLVGAAHLGCDRPEAR